MLSQHRNNVRCVCPTVFIEWKNMLMAIPVMVACGFARGAARKSYSMRTSMLVEYTLFKTLYTSHNVVVFHRNNIRQVILRVYSPQIRTTVVCGSTDEYICMRRYLSTLIPHSYSTMTCFFCSYDTRIRSLTGRIFIEITQCVRVVYRICYVDRSLFTQNLII